MAETKAATKSKSAKASQLTPKEAKFVKGIAEGKTKTQAALDAYNAKDDKSASVIAAQTLGKVRVQDALKDAFESAGITPDAIAKTLKDAMSANKSATFKGTVFSSAEPDHAVRSSAARAAAALMGANDKDDSGGGTINFNFGTQNYVKKVEVKP